MTARSVLGAALLLVVMAGFGRCQALTEQQKQRVEELNRLGVEAQKQFTAGNLPQAITALEKGVAIAREVYANTPEMVADTLEILAGMHESVEGFAAARKAREEVLAIRTKLHGKEDWRVTDARLALEDIARQEKLDAEGRRQLRDANGRSRQVAPLYWQGKYKEAIQLAEQVRQTRGRLLGENHPGYATSLNNLALLYQAVGEYTRALPLFEQARDTNRKALGENHPSYANNLNNLALLYQATGEYAKAVTLFEQARDIKKKAQGENHAEYATSLNNLAVLYQDTGDYARALPLLEQALDIRKRVQGEAHPDYANSLNSLAVLYKATGDYARAVALCEQACDIRKKAPGENHPSYATSLNNLALLYMLTGDHARALPLYQQACEIRKKALGENHSDYAGSLNNLATLHEATGDHARAVQLSEQACDIWKKALSENHPSYATGLSNLARLYMAGGEYSRALPLYEQVRDIRKKVLGENHPDYANSVSNLAALYHETRDARAAPLAHQALVARVAASDSAFAARNPRLRLQFLAEHRFMLDRYLSVALPSSAEPPQVHAHVLAWKGAAAGRQAEERIAFDHPELAPLLDNLRRARAALAQVAQAPPRDSRAQPEWIARLRTLEADKEQLETQLSVKSAAFRRFRNATPDAVAETLPTNAALVDLLEYTYATPSKTQRGRYDLEQRFLAFVLRKGHAPVLVELGRAQPIDDAVNAWRKSGLKAVSADESARRLKELVWQPLHKHLGDATLVFLSPDGSLCKFPFAALPGGKPGSFLVEEITFTHITSGRHLLELNGERKEPEHAGLLALGDLDFGKPSDGAGSLWRELPGTRLEVERVRALFARHFPAEREPRLLTGSGIDSARLQREATPREGPRWRYLHLATHGFFEEPRKSAPERKLPDGPLTVEQLRWVYDHNRNPLLSSGLVLSGANADPGKGVLTAEEVSSLDLRGVDLAVLSACETGLGKVSGSQGVQGLQLAFQAAGARSLLVSLWRVDDAATSVLMEEFYTNLWQKKMSRAEALQQAQVTVLKNRARVLARCEELREQLVKRGVPEEVLASRGLGNAVNVPNGGKAEAGERHSPPSWWAAFLLSGDPGKIE